MAKKYQSKIFFFFGFGLVFGLSLVLFYLYPMVSQAADVNITACVPSTEICNNSYDDDCDGFQDCNDNDCIGDSACALAEDCTNGIDDDFDGDIDCDDSDCAGHPSCSGECFLAGTKILFAGGQYLEIEKVQAGDEVISYEEDLGEKQISVVLQTFEHQADKILVINEILNVTPNHPLYVNGFWQSAGSAKIGDKFFDNSGNEIIVNSIREEVGKFTVYNLEVDKNHNYFAENILAHNKGGEPICGNGLLESGEQCDDGNTVSGDGCSESCIVEQCGNTILDVGEQCDDGNTVSGDGCSSICQNEVCGDGHLDAPYEECDDNNTTNGDGCSASCLLEECGNDRIDYNEECDDGDDNSNSNPDTCRTDCRLPYCGDNVIDTGEECDDGNTTSGDDCSDLCELEIGCGNGIVEVGLGEQCDDNNIVSGDCCSETCQKELIINPNVSESVTNTSATIGWSILCAPNIATVSSQLEWGQTIAVDEGVATGFVGSPKTHLISGLSRNTVYNYLITATQGGIQDTYANTFLTTGGVEDCNNGLDDDNDGLCDYPASTCTDGSQPGDPECACSPNFFCQTSTCVSGFRTITCIDQSSPKCQPNQVTTEICEICPGVIIGTCQQLNEETCTAVNIPNCCGNNICEPPGENPTNCFVDCPVDCISEWECTDWTPEDCPPSGIKSRSCFDNNACQIPINPPDTQQSCDPRCLDLTCAQDEQINFNTCACEKIVPFCPNGICEIGENHTSCPQDCIEECIPNWTCMGWGACTNNIQTRECYDLNNCNLNIDRPPEIHSCETDCDVACSTCQEINLSSCSCTPIAPCCGNRSCESEETGWSCPIDCGLPPNLRITLTDCLDGFDNDKDGLVDYPADPGCSTPADRSELNLAEVVENISKFIENTIIKQVLDNPAVEQANESIAAPAVIAITVVNTFATFSFFNFFSYFQYLVTQPLAVLFRRRRKKWGIVYNALTKQPADLAIVRLYQKETGRLVQSRVTDKQGRYAFIVAPGDYYLTVTKPKFDFPTALLKDRQEDGKYLDLYHGETIKVTDKNVAITANIPLDPRGDERPAARIILQYYLRKVQYAVAFLAVPLAAISMVISPGPLTFTLFGFHCLLYVLFRRLGYQKPPKSWGMVYDKTNNKPIGLAITRIYDKDYNKLLETRVTDARGRYAFLVDNNIYYMTADKLGYHTAKTSDIDLKSKTREAIVGMNIGLEKSKPGQTPAPTPPLATPTPSSTPPEDRVGLPAKAVEPPIPSPQPPVPSEPKPATPTEEKTTPAGEKSSITQKPSLDDLEDQIEDLSVGRESLEELIKRRQAAQEIKEDIQEQKEQLEDLEDKVEDIEEDIEDKIKENKPIENKESLVPTPTENKPVSPAQEEKSKKTPPPSSQGPEKSIFG